MRRLATFVALVLVAGCAGSAGPSPGSTPSPVATRTPAPSSTAATPSSPGASASASAPASAAPSYASQVTLITHDDFALSDSVIAQFEAQEHVHLNVLRSGDAGQMVNQAILTKDHPLADVLYGVDNTFLSRALDAGIFVPYVSPAAAPVPAQFQLDPKHRVTPTDYGDVCLNIDLKAFAAGNPPAPTQLTDLTKPAYRSMLVVENPATSSPGLAFMLATIARFGETGSYTWLDYWRDLRANDVKVSATWDDAYDSQFSGSNGGTGGGDRPIVVSYASSPPAEVYYAASPPPSAPTAVITDGCFRQVEFVGVLAGAANPAAAQAFVDFMLSPAVQGDIPLQMFVFPVVPNTPLPDVFVKYAVVPTQPLSLDPATIGANRDRWIGEWTDTVLH